MLDFIMASFAVVAFFSYAMYRSWQDYTPEMRVRMQSAGFPEVDEATKRSFYLRLCIPSCAFFLVLGIYDWLVMDNWTFWKILALMIPALIGRIYSIK